MPSQRLAVPAPSRRRIRYHAMKTTMDHPIPIKSRLAPVMFASASPHGDSVPPPGGGRHAGPVASNEFPPCQAKTKSTAYSGSTAMSASRAIAKPAEMSSCATSAAHDRMNAAPTIARPNSAASTVCGRSGAVARMIRAGTVRGDRERQRESLARWVDVGGIVHERHGVPPALEPKVSSPRRAEGRRAAMRDRDDGVTLVGLLPFEASP